LAIGSSRAENQMLGLCQDVPCVIFINVELTTFYSVTRLFGFGSSRPNTPVDTQANLVLFLWKQAQSCVQSCCMKHGSQDLSDERSHATFSNLNVEIQTLRGNSYLQLLLTRVSSLG